MNQHKSHIIPVRTYFLIAAALLALTALTVMLSFVNLGPFNVAIALAIASVKALLVAFFFMHLMWDRKIYLVIFAMALLFLTIFLTFTMFDTTTRGAIYREKNQLIKPQAPMYQVPK
jgi:cytochrome c oxidase subunit IV